MQVVVSGGNTCGLHLVEFVHILPIKDSRYVICYSYNDEKISDRLAVGNSGSFPSGQLGNWAHKALFSQLMNKT